MKSRNFALSSAITQYSISIIPTLGSGGPQSGPVKHICLSLCLCVSVSVGSSASLFGEHLRGPYFSAAHAAAGHRFRSIISTVVLYPHTGVRRTPVGSSWAYMSVSLHICLVELICPSLCLSVYLSLCPVVLVDFWRSKRAARNCAQRMRPQATGSNPLSGSIICPSVRSSAGLLQFLYLYSCPAWESSVVMHLSPDWGPKDPSGVQSSLYFRVSVYLSLCPVFRVAFWRSKRSPLNLN